MTDRQRTWLAHTLRLGLAAMFGFAGVLKLGDPWQFATEIANYHLLPELAGLAAAALPTVEIAIAIALIASPVGSRWLTAASALSTGVLSLFTLAVVQVVVRNIDVSCGCFGKGSGTVSWWTVARDLAFLSASLALSWLSRRRVLARQPAA